MGDSLGKMIGDAITRQMASRGGAAGRSFRRSDPYGNGLPSPAEAGAPEGLQQDGTAGLFDRMFQHLITGSADELDVRPALPEIPGSASALSFPFAGNVTNPITQRPVAGHDGTPISTVNSLRSIPTLASSGLLLGMEAVPFEYIDALVSEVLRRRTGV